MSSVKRRCYKVCLVGKPNVGKTSIFNAFRGIPFSFSPKAEIDEARVPMKVNDPADTSRSLDLDLRVWDTAGMDRYQSLTESYYKRASAIIVVFSKGCYESFTFIGSIMDDINRMDCCPDSLFFLVGNKVDLKEEDIFVHDKVVNEFIEDKSWLFQKYLKTSAKTGAGIQDLLHEIASSVVAGKGTRVRYRHNLTSLIHQQSQNGSCCS